MLNRIITSLRTHTPLQPTNLPTLKLERSPRYSQNHSPRTQLAATETQSNPKSSQIGKTQLTWSSRPASGTYLALRSRPRSWTTSAMCQGPVGPVCLGVHERRLLRPVRGLHRPNRSRWGCGIRGMRAKGIGKGRWTEG